MVNGEAQVGFDDAKPDASHPEGTRRLISRRALVSVTAEIGWHALAKRQHAHARE